MPAEELAKLGATAVVGGRNDEKFAITADLGGFGAIRFDLPMLVTEFRRVGRVRIEWT